jgi:hypothetical protein
VLRHPDRELGCEVPVLLREAVHFHLRQRRRGIETQSCQESGWQGGVGACQRGNLLPLALSMGLLKIGFGLLLLPRMLSELQVMYPPRNPDFSVYRAYINS